jgi:hypothetical protein
LFCPVTSKIKGYPFEVELPDEYAVSGVVLSDQLKSLDWRSRKAKLIGRVSSDIVVTLLQLSNTPLEWTGRRQLSASPPWLPACHSGAALSVSCKPLNESRAWYQQAVLCCDEAEAPAHP